MKLSNYIYNKVGIVAAAFSALALGSCSDADSIPNVSPAYCPSEVTLEKIGRASCRERVYVLV